MKRLILVSVIVLAMEGLAPAQPEEISVASMPPVVVKTVPRSGDTSVEASISEIRVTFSKDMMDGNWSWTQISDESFPTTTGKPRYLADRRTCVLPVKLQGGKTYVTWLNSQSFGNFKDTQGHSAVPYLLVFETGNGSTTTVERPSSPRAAQPKVEIPEGAVRLSHTGETTEDKRSIGGSGHAIAFERPAEAKSVIAVEIFASRYGYPKPPKEDFHVYLLDADMKVIKDLAFPYSRIKRTGKMQWYTFAVPGVPVPDKFHVALSFNPHRTKGIYLGLDKNVEESHSFTGLPDSGYKPVTDGYDWMVRAYLVSETKGPNLADPFADPGDDSKN